MVVDANRLNADLSGVHGEDRLLLALTIIAGLTDGMFEIHKVQYLTIE